MRIGEIDVEIVRKKIKHFHLYVKPPYGEVSVSVPLATTDENIRIFVEENIGWVVKKRQEVAEQPRLPKRKWVSGETVLVWGERYFLTVNRSLGRQYTVRLSGNRMELDVPPLSTSRSREAFMAEWYRNQLYPVAEEITHKWSKITGFNAEEVIIQKMTRCWGTCSIANARIRLNLLLARQPKEALEYIVLHELCHLRYKNHNKAFVALLDKYMPNWRDVKKRLREAPLDCIVEN